MPVAAESVCYTQPSQSGSLSLIMPILACDLLSCPGLLLIYCCEFIRQLVFYSTEITLTLVTPPGHQRGGACMRRSLITAH